MTEATYGAAAPLLTFGYVKRLGWSKTLQPHKQRNKASVFLKFNNYSSVITIESES